MQLMTKELKQQHEAEAWVTQHAHGMLVDDVQAILAQIRSEQGPVAPPETKGSSPEPCSPLARNAAEPSTAQPATSPAAADPAAASGQADAWVPIEAADVRCRPPAAHNHNARHIGTAAQQTIYSNKTSGKWNATTGAPAVLGTVLLVGMLLSYSAYAERRPLRTLLYKSWKAAGKSVGDIVGLALALSPNPGASTFGSMSRPSESS